jgi:hypothetical protein
MIQVVTKFNIHKIRTKFNNFNNKLVHLIYQTLVLINYYHEVDNLFIKNNPS